MNALSPFSRRVVLATPEVARVAALPRRHWSDEDAAKLAEILTRELKTPSGTMSLRPVQAVALYEAMQAGGLFGPIRVGAGKSLVCALMPLVLEAKRPVLLMPASLVAKTWDERKVLEKHWRLPTNVQIISYESLSLVQSAQKLEYIQPDLLVCDEAHYLKGHRAGRTRRVVRYMHSYPDTKFVAVSGTVMKASLRDFAHLLRFALKGQAPIPASEEELDTWADCLDEKVNPLAQRQPAAIFDLGARPVGVDTLTAARRVFQARLLETRGVVASSKNDGVTCSIRIEALEYQLTPVMEGHFETLRRRSETPCGKSFAEAAEMRMYARELGLGFTYTWIPKEKANEWDALIRQNNLQQGQRPTSVGGKPTQNDSKSSSGVAKKIPSASPLRSTMLAKIVTGLHPSSMRNSSNGPAAVANSAEDPFATARSQSTSITTITPDVSADCFARGAIQLLDSSRISMGLNEHLRIFLDRNKAPSTWLSTRRAWHAFVRGEIENSHRYDTMLQVANACLAGLLNSETLDAWKEIESSYEPLTRPIFYDMTALETCLDWLKSYVGIVWVEHRAFGDALSALAGVPYFGPGGLDASGASISNEKGDRPVVASIAACGQGFNLQMFSKNLITSCPSGAATVEQVLGRTHRDGQLADEVLVWILLGCREHYDAFDHALEGAKAAEATLGHSQKILLADVIFPNIDNRKGPLWG